MDFLPGGPEISLEILFRDVVLRSFIDVLPTDLAMDLVQVLLRLCVKILFNST